MPLKVGSAVLKNANIRGNAEKRKRLKSNNRVRNDDLVAERIMGYFATLGSGGPESRKTKCGANISDFLGWNLPWNRKNDWKGRLFLIGSGKHYKLYRRETVV